MNEHHDGSHCHNPIIMEDNQTTVIGQDFVGEEKHEDSLDASPVMLPSNSVEQNSQAQPSDLVKTLDSPKCNQGTLIALTIAYYVHTFIIKLWIHLSYSCRAKLRRGGTERWRFNSRWPAQKEENFYKTCSIP